jgi:hypothetical protein
LYSKRLKSLVQANDVLPFFPSHALPDNSCLDFGVFDIGVFTAGLAKRWRWATRGGDGNGRCRPEPRAVMKAASGGEDGGSIARGHSGERKLGVAFFFV